jgi:hypothetical protein
MLTDVKPKLDGLSAILAELIDAHKRLAACALGLRDALVACDNDAIERLCRENERIAADVRKLENKRIEFLRDAGLNEPASASFSSLEKAIAGAELTDEEKTALDDLRKLRLELAGYINHVDHHNQLNLTLVGQALEFHEFSLRLLINAAGGEATGYTPEGPSHPEKDSGIFNGLA